MNGNVGHEEPPRKSTPTGMGSRAERLAYLRASGGQLPARDPLAARWLVAPIVGPLIARLSRGKLGWCNSTECGLRAMAWVDTGHIYGQRSLGRWIARETKAKRLLHKRIPPGAYFKQTGRWSKKGTQLNRWPSDAERRASRGREKIERRKARAAAARANQKQKQEVDERERQRRAELRHRQQGQQLATAAEVSASVAQAMALVQSARAAALAPPAELREHVQSEIERARAWAQAEGVPWDPPAEFEPDSEGGS